MHIMRPVGDMNDGAAGHVIQLPAFSEETENTEEAAQNPGLCKDIPWAHAVELLPRKTRHQNKAIIGH